jgi:hypothetical protein
MFVPSFPGRLIDNGAVGGRIIKGGDDFPFRESGLHWSGFLPKPTDQPHHADDNQGKQNELDG